MPVSDKVILIGICDIENPTTICDGSIVGKSFRQYLDGTREDTETTIISKNTYIGYYSIIGTGTVISECAIIDDYSVIESRVKIGKSTLVCYRAQICNDSIIGKECIVGGFIGERSLIGDNCRVFGKLIHSQNDPSIGWDDDEAVEKAPIVDDYVFIGFNSLIIGDVKIGRNSYVCAGATVTENVPEFHVVYGKNIIKPFEEWKGSLVNSSFFKKRVPTSSKI